jgi:CBS domain containing-hemolysin-like protein
LNTEATLAECLDVADKTRYSRFPLCEGGDLDRALGVVHIKDLYAMRHRARTGLELAPIARRIIYVPETAHLERILRVFLDRKLHLAIVVDEFGGTVGMVTLENILEELVGQIQDEFDQEKPRITKTGERSWDLEGTLPLHELAHIIGEPLREEGVATVAGLVTQRMGGFPREGDKLPLGAYELSVAVTEGLVVKRLRLVKLQDAPPPG